MITRIYANNFRCLVSFEVKLDSFGVLCGPNGVGKSSVFDVIKLIRDLASADAILGGEGKYDIQQLEFTSWLDSHIQEFEVSISIGEKEFLYKIQIEQTSNDVKPRVIYETATCNGDELFSRDLDGVRLVRDDGATSGFPLDWRQSALGAIQSSKRTSNIELLQDYFRKILVLRPCAPLMSAESRSDASMPTLQFENLLSWYRTLANEQEWTDSLRESLQDVWPDFRSFNQVEVGLNSKSLRLRFDSDNGRSSSPYFFHQMSDGERTLIGLYMLRAAMETDAARIILIDEPDNYIGLPELQPWVLSICELLDEHRQVIIISHHPEILKSASKEHGRYLWRDNHSSPTRIGALEVPDGMTPGEAIARGWLTNG